MTLLNLEQVSKWVAVSPARFAGLEVEPEGLRVDLLGAPGEQARRRGEARGLPTPQVSKWVLGL